MIGHYDTVHPRGKLSTRIEDNLLFGGRLGLYKYMNMDQVIKEALFLVQKEKDEPY